MSKEKESGLDSAHHAFLSLARHYSLFTLDELAAGKTDIEEATRLLNVVLRGVSSNVPAATARRFALGASEAEGMRNFIDTYQNENPFHEEGEALTAWNAWRTENPPTEAPEPKPVVETEPEAPVSIPPSNGVMGESDYAAPHNGQLVMVPTVSIVPSPLNPRRHIDPEGITALANDITLFGIQQPLTIRPYESLGGGEDLIGAALARYEIVAGERRWRAACQADLPEVPCIIRDVSDAELVQRALSENLQRDGLDAYSEAWGYAKALETDSSLTQAILGNRYGKSQTYISRMLGLLKLPESVTGFLASGRLDRSHGFALLPLIEHPDSAATIAELAVREEWTLDALTEKVKLRKTAIEERDQPTLPGTEASSPRPSTSTTTTTTTTTPSAPEVKPDYTQEDAKKEFEESGGPVAPRTETPALDAAREKAEEAPEPVEAPPSEAPPVVPAGSGERVATAISAEDDEWLFEEALNIDQALQFARRARLYLTGDSVKLLKVLTDDYNAREGTAIAPWQHLFAILGMKAKEVGLDIDTILENPE